MSKANPSDRRLEEAMDWLLRLREAPGDKDLRDQVEAWVAAHPDHRRAWNRARETWQVLGDLPPATAGAWEEPAAAERQVQPQFARRRTKTGRRSLRRAGLVATALAAAACLALVFAPALSLRLEADHVTAAAEIREVILPDGSVAHLAPQTAVDLRFTDERRGLALLRGEAFFEVTTDPTRPFVVEAEGLQARVVGTAFGVSLSAGRVDVEVESGRVAVQSDAATTQVDLRLRRGQTLQVDQERQSALKGRKAPAEMAAWRHGQLLVVDASVAEVVERLRRYHAGWILLLDDGLAAKRVNGVYDLRDPDKALQALVHPVGGEVHAVTPLLRVLR